jgi:hypothetical protein
MTEIGQLTMESIATTSQCRALPTDVTGLRLDQASYAAQQAGFTDPVRAYDLQQLAWLQIESHSAQQMTLPAPQMQTADGESGGRT